MIRRSVSLRGASVNERRGNPTVKKEIASQASPDRNDISNLC